MNSTSTRHHPSPPGQVSTLASLVVVATTLGAGVGASVLLKDEYNEAE